MAVHHFTAPDMVVARGWQPIETFPRDGSVVEVRNAAGTIARASWGRRSQRIETTIQIEPTQWRNLE